MTRSLLLTLALLPACAYNAAMSRGEDASASSAWIRAHTAYSFAHDTKQTPEAEAGMDAAIAGLVAEAEADIGNDDFVAGFQKLDIAETLDPDDERVDAAREAAQQRLVDVLPSRTDTKDVHEGYVFAATAKRLHPTSWVVEDVLQMLRDRVVADAREKQDAMEWEEARAAARVILDYEPEHQTLADGLDQDIVADWVAHLVRGAEKAERGRPGLAAILYARAHEVGDSAEHMDKARTLYEVAGADAARKVYVDSEGSGGHHWGVRKAVTAAALELDGVEKGYSSKYDMQAKIYANTIDCDERSEKEAKTKDYVAGTRQVPNPEYDALEASLAEAKKEKAAADKQQAGLASKHSAQQAKVEDLQKKQLDAETAHDKASDALEQTKKQHTQSQEAADAVKKEIAMWEEQGSEEGVSKAQAKLKDAEKVVREWADKLQADLKAESSTAAALEAAEEKLAPAQKAFDTLDTELQAANTRVGEAEKEVETLEGTLAKTDETLPEDIKKTHSYDEVTWTMTCTAKATVYFNVGWKTERDKKVVFEGERVVKDTAVRGHEPSDTKEDPKEYGKSSKELIEELEAEQLAAINAEVDAFVADYFSSTAAAALADEDGDAATDTLVRLVSGAPTRLKKKTRVAAVDAVKKHQGLKDYAALDPGATAGADEPEEAPAEAPKAEKEPEKKPEPKAAEPKPEPKAEPKAEPKPEPKAAPKEEPKPAPKEAEDASTIWK